jgi:hypothetical protein
MIRRIRDKGTDTPMSLARFGGSSAPPAASGASAVPNLSSFWCCGSGVCEAFACCVVPVWQHSGNATQVGFHPSI